MKKSMFELGLRLSVNYQQKARYSEWSYFHSHPKNIFIYYIDIQLLNIKFSCWGWNQWSAILPVHWPQQVYSWIFNTYGQMLIKFFVFLYAIQSRGGNKKEVDEPQESISLDPLQRMEVSSHYVGLVKINFLHILKNQHTDHSTWQLKPTNRTGLLSKK